MARREVITMLEDVVQHIARAERVVSLDGFMQDPMLQDALTRNLEIMGEALYQANKLNRSLPVTDKEKIIGLRHIIVHDYYAVEYDKLWAMTTVHLSQLKAEVTALRDQEHIRLFGSANPELPL